MKYKDIKELSDEELAKKVEESSSTFVSRWPRASLTTPLA